MSTETNKAIVMRLWEEVWKQNKLSVCDLIFDEEYARHESGFVPVLRSAFPDLHFTVQDMIAEGDKVVTRYRFGGTHKGHPTEDELKSAEDFARKLLEKNI